MRTSGVQQSDSVIYIHIHVWKWKSLSRVRLCGRHGLQSPRSSPGQNTGVSSCSLLQGIFPTQGSNPGLPHCRRILYQLSHQGSTLSKKFIQTLVSQAVNRSQWGSCSATYETPTQKQVIYEWFTCKYLLNFIYIQYIIYSSVYIYSFHYGL